MKAPDISLNYPNGSRALEITGVDVDNIGDLIKLGTGFTSIFVTKLPKLQPLINDFYEIYKSIEAMR
jgi:hypothetical protein